MSSSELAIYAILKALIPLFLGADKDRHAAEAAAREALAAYDPRTLTDHIAAARVITFSLGAVAATGKALDPELPEKRQFQYLTKANSFARFAQKAEAALEKARKQRSAEPLQPQPALQPEPKPRPQPTPEPKPEPRSATPASQPSHPEHPTQSRRPSNPNAAPSTAADRIAAAFNAPLPSDAAIESLLGRVLGDLNPLPHTRPAANAKTPSFRQSLLQGAAVPTQGTR